MFDKKWCGEQGGWDIREMNEYKREIFLICFLVCTVRTCQHPMPHTQPSQEGSPHP